MTISALLFDKDGTLFDFEASWADWTHRMIAELSGGSDDLLRALSTEIGFDMEHRRFLAHSPVIAGTLEEVCSRISYLFPDLTTAELTRIAEDSSATARMVPATPLLPLLGELRDRGLMLGVATNASAAEAAAHLAGAGIAEAFDFVAGYDSGHGAKPDPGMCLAFARGIGLAPHEVLMVGDSLHDLHAGRAAGMRTIAVLTGLATEAELSPYADAVLPHIGHLPDWLQHLDARTVPGEDQAAPR